MGRLESSFGSLEAIFGSLVAITGRFGGILGRLGGIGDVAESRRTESGIQRERFS